MGDTGPRVLIVDDELAIRRFLRASLSAQGYQLFEASSTREGLDAAATVRPDLVILDLGLPDLDGVEVTRRLREWSKVPVLILSVRGRGRGEDRGARRGRGRLPDEAVQQLASCWRGCAWPCGTRPSRPTSRSSPRGI